MRRAENARTNTLVNPLFRERSVTPLSASDSMKNSNSIILNPLTSSVHLYAA
ncbi:MAG: hypothetical protein BWY89_02056 [Bacteroidetes bacterium ADurb.BinA012]|nr:MAG: hypothetical protein BWY89_02056 [Bacteroidetes bacterium ADurb.BinA012]